MLYAVIFICIMYLVIGVASLGSRDRTQHDYEDYHHDPFYYYPRNEPPAFFGGYPQYPANPYYPPPPPPIIRYATVRPQPGGAFFYRIITLLLIAALLLGIAIKLNLVNIYVSIGNPGFENNHEWQRDGNPPENNIRDSDYNPIRSAKNKN